MNDSEDKVGGQSDRYQLLKLGAGERVVEGKTRWADFIEVQINDERDALDLAMRLLNQYQVRRDRGASRSPISLNLTGVLSTPDE